MNTGILLLPYYIFAISVVTEPYYIRNKLMNFDQNWNYSLNIHKGSGKGF